MDMIDYIYGKTIKGIPLFSIPTLLEDNDNCIFKAGAFFIKYNDKIIPFGCIKDIYADPNTGKKVSVPKISNPCLYIKTAFNIQCINNDCVSCHKIAADKAINDKLILLKK